MSDINFNQTLNVPCENFRAKTQGPMDQWPYPMANGPRPKNLELPDTRQPVVVTIEAGRRHRAPTGRSPQRWSDNHHTSLDNAYKSKDLFHRDILPLLAKVRIFNRIASITLGTSKLPWSNCFWFSKLLISRSGDYLFSHQYPSGLCHMESDSIGFLNHQMYLYFVLRSGLVAFLASSSTPSKLRESSLSHLLRGGSPFRGARKAGRSPSISSRARKGRLVPESHGYWRGSGGMHSGGMVTGKVFSHSAFPNVPSGIWHAFPNSVFSVEKSAISSGVHLAASWLLLSGFCICSIMGSRLRLLVPACSR